MVEEKAMYKSAVQRSVILGLSNKTLVSKISNIWILKLCLYSCVSCVELRNSNNKEMCE